MRHLPTLFGLVGLVGLPAACSTASSSQDTDGETGTDTDTGASGTTTGDATTGGTTTGVTDGSSSTGETGTPTGEGFMTVLTYNVAGLPQGISGSNPEVNMPQISPLLNLYDLALVQEDFAYHTELAADAEHPYQSEPKAPAGGTDMGDGLNRFSQTPFSSFERHAWNQCHGEFDSGSDCLTSKGFSVGEHELEPGVTLDIYNLHMDAGGGAEDVAARQAQINQLVTEINIRSAGKAVIVAGDTNLGGDDEADVMTLLQNAGLTDTCRQLSCGEESRIDRIMYRESDTLSLVPSNWRVDPAFVDENGEDLSDHEAIGVDFDWAVK